jgi:hypothetical protein
VFLERIVKAADQTFLIERLAPEGLQHLDLTAFDAWIEYRCGERKGFIGIETKLTESFSQAEYSFASPGYSR